MPKLDNLDKLFVVWAFLFQILLIIHFAIRKPLFESHTVKYGWIFYAICIPAVVIGIILMHGGKGRSFWLGGFLFLVFAIFGYWVGYVAQIQFRSPLRLSVVFSYAFCTLPLRCFTGCRSGFSTALYGSSMQYCSSSQPF